MLKCVDASCITIGDHIIALWLGIVINIKRQQNDVCVFHVLEMPSDCKLTEWSFFRETQLKIVKAD